MQLVRSLCIFLCALASFAALPHAAKNTNSIGSGIQVIEINEHIFMLRGAGGNIGVLKGQDHIIMIDSQFEHTSDSVKLALQSISDKPLAYLINTHYHSDHTGGNPSFARDGVTMIAHEKTREILAADRDMATPNSRLPEYSDKLLPYLTFSQSITLHEGNELIEVIHFPNAHTASDSAVFFKTSNVIHTGDLYFVGVTPFIDVKNGGSYDGYVSAMQAILNRADENTKIIPGHGPLATKAMMQRDYEDVASFDHTSLD